MLVYSEYCVAPIDGRGVAVRTATRRPARSCRRFFFFKQKTAYDIGLGIPAEPSSDLFALIFVLVLFGWMYLARLIRGEVISLREREFVQSARAIGAPLRGTLSTAPLPH